MAPKPLTFDEMAVIHYHERRRLDRLHMQQADLEALAMEGGYHHGTIRCEHVQG